MARMKECNLTAQECKNHAQLICFCCLNSTYAPSVFMWLSVHFLPYIDNEKPHNTRKISILFNFFHSEIRKLNLYMRTITVSKQARIISIFFVLFLSLLGSTDFRFTSHIFQLLIDYGFFYFEVIIVFCVLCFSRRTLRFLTLNLNSCTEQI